MQGYPFLIRGADKLLQKQKTKYRVMNSHFFTHNQEYFRNSRVTNV
jgi:hypothetical protein